MTTISIVMLVLGIIAMLVGLLLSTSGSTSGLTSIAGQDLELFKKTKDKGFVKFLQMIMFTLTIVLIVLAILAQVFGWGAASPEEPTEAISVLINLLGY